MTASASHPADEAARQPALLVRDDPERIGFALLQLDPPPDDSLGVSIRFLDGTFLGRDGRRSRERCLFVAEPRPARGTFALGPAVTAHVPEAEVVTLADQRGAVLGTLAWDSIRPPPGPRPGALVGAGAVVVPPTTRIVTAHIAPPDPIPDGGAPASAPGATTLATSLRRRQLGGTVALWVILPVLVAAAVVVGILSGRLGWAVEPPILSFVAVAGGPVPGGQDAVLRAAWYARPFAQLLGRVFRTGDAPAWLALAKRGVALHVEARSEALPPGEHRFRVPAVFPLDREGAGLAVEVVLRVDPAVASPPPALPAVPPAQPAPQPALAAGGVDDTACDKAAGSRFDPDHPAAGGFVEDVFDLAQAAVEGGIAACDPRPDRTGRDRRILVQHGRLLAARALLRAENGDPAAARRDMDEAIIAWTTGSGHGSALADSLLGSYAFGSLNRPSLTFMPPDEVAATLAWKRGMERGSVVAQRNYAAQLMAGRGVEADAARAVTLLRDAIARGDERAAGILGVALYTGVPADVTMNKAEGWPLVVRAQCLDKASRDLVTAEVQRGSHPQDDRRGCA